MNNEPKVIIDLKEYRDLTNANFLKDARIIELKSELRKANRTINSLKETLNVVVKDKEN